MLKVSVVFLRQINARAPNRAHLLTDYGKIADPDGLPGGGPSIIAPLDPRYCGRSKRPMDFPGKQLKGVGMPFNVTEADSLCNR